MKGGKLELFIAIASIICGAEGWNEMEEFGRAKKDWLKTFLRLPGGYSLPRYI
jgi:hypothetical protein